MYKMLAMRVLRNRL